MRRRPSKGQRPAHRRGNALHTRPGDAARVWPARQAAPCHFHAVQADSTAMPSLTITRRRRLFSCPRPGTPGAHTTNTTAAWGLCRHAAAKWGLLKDNAMSAPPLRQNYLSAVAFRNFSSSARVAGSAYSGMLVNDSARSLKDARSGCVSTCIPAASSFCKKS